MADVESYLGSGTSGETRHLGIKKRGIVHVRSRRGTVTKVIALSISVLFLALIVGFFMFLGQVNAAARSKPKKADAIVAFSGDPRRIQMATLFLKNGLGKRLIIVGQDNKDEVSRLSVENRLLFKCCVEIDHRSTDTAEDALLAKRMIQKAPTRSVLIVTSAFHIPRARRELRRLLPDIKIESYGLSDDTYNTDNVFFNPTTSMSFVSQYLVYVLSFTPGGRALLSEETARKIAYFLSASNNFSAILILVVTSLFAVFAMSKHRGTSDR